MLRERSLKYIEYLGVWGQALYCALIFAKFGDLERGTGMLLSSIFLTSIVLYLPVSKLVDKLKGFRIKTEVWIEDERKVFILVTLVTFGLYFIWWLGYMPGGFAGDPTTQWKQSAYSLYNDWHPALHTLLFFTFPMNVSSYIGSIVLFQIIYFSVALGYLMSTMTKWQCEKKYWLITYIYIVCNPFTLSAMMCPWKDCALTITLIVLTGQMMNIYFTNGEWIEKRTHIILIAITLALGSIFRHNAVLYTGVFILIMAYQCKKQLKSILKIIMAVIVLLIVIRGPLYSYYNVAEPGARPLEVLGFPMTVLGNVISQDKDALSEETKDFLYAIASQKEWENIYEVGNFNSIKREMEPGSAIESVIPEYGIRNVLRSMMEAIIKSKKFSAEAIWKLTDMVWDVGNEVDYYILPDFPEDFPVENVRYSGIERMKQIEDKLVYLSTRSIFGVLFWNIGLIMFAILAFSLCFLRQRKCRNVLIFLPLLIYNIGTMFLLTGNDVRFFHFNFVIICPLFFIALREN